LLSYEVLDMLPACDRNVSGALRLPILSKYKDMGTVVEGKVCRVGGVWHSGLCASQFTMHKVLLVRHGCAQHTSMFSFLRA
jgi:hypothetical protein